MSIKKILIIANLYHASPRIPGLATYLSEFGWEATIVTSPLGEDAKNRFGFPKGFLEKVKIIEAPYRGDIFWYWRNLFKSFGIKKTESITEQIKNRFGITEQKSLVDIMLRWYQTFFAYPDTEKTWKAPALRAAINVLKDERFDAILSSSPFPTVHIVANKLKKQFALPWIADFRDPWSENHAYPYPNLRKTLDTILEKKTMRSVDAFVTASPSYAQKIAKLHKRHVYVITNGFDSNNVVGEPNCLPEKFTITYTGTIYAGKQDPKKILKALRNLIKQKLINSNDIEVRFYGKINNWLKNEIISNNLADIVKQYGTISRSESLAKQRESHLLLLLNWEDPDEKGIYPLKFFEYLSAQRPIIATGGFRKDDLDIILNETNAGNYATDTTEIELSLLKAIDEYKQTGIISYKGDLKEINKYAYVELSRKLSDILNQMN